jgi:hypothetical protein
MLSCCFVNYSTEYLGLGENGWDVGGTGLKGVIPTELGLMSNLKWLFLNTNQFTSTIPTELGLLSNLELLGFGSNFLNGTIPTELGLLSNLEYMSLNRNRLTGTIPTIWGSLSLLGKPQPPLFQYSFTTMGSHVCTSS